MDDVLNKSAWQIAVSGIVAIIFGLIALFMPGLTLATIILLFGAFAIVFGLVQFFGAIANRKEKKAWPGLLGGLVSIIIGIVVFSWVGLTALFLLYLIAFWAIFAGLMDIIFSFQVEGDYNNWGLILLRGLVSIIFGIVALVYPGATALVLIWLIGIWAVIMGIMLIVLSIMVKKEK